MAARKQTKTKYALVGLGPATSKRPAKVAGAIRENIAELLLRKIRDPRVAGITISTVDVAPDLRNATIYFYCAEGNEQKALEGLESAQGFLRSKLAKVLALRYMPVLVFKHDLSMSHQSEISRIFREIENERRSPPEDS